MFSFILPQVNNGAVILIVYCAYVHREFLSK